MDETKLISFGLDYIRVTAEKPEEKSSMQSRAMLLMVEEGTHGYDVKTAGMIGFLGKKTKHVFYGQRQEWAMFQVSGYMAREWTNSLLATPGKATRLDLQVTVRLPGAVTETIQQAEASSIAAKPADGRHWQTRLVRTDGRAQTVYIGSRTSEYFGRIYDKYAESGDEVYRDCVRYEVEVKGDAARDMWAALKASPRAHQNMISFVIAWFHAHGVEIAIDVPLAPPELPKKQVQHEDERRLGWLFHQVSGTVAKLCAGGNWFPSLNALFSKALLPEDRQSIIYAMERIW